jgi:hypothetical protein
VLVVTACAGLGLTLTLAQGGQAATAPGPATGAAPTYKATVTVTKNVVGKIGRTYVGLSFESSTLNKDDRYDTGGNLVRLLKNLGPGIMRFGGNSADLSAFTGSDSETLHGLARLTRATGWSVIYTENLGRFNAAHVTDDTRAVKSALGSKLFAFACGNEPDQFVASGVRRPPWTIGQYLPQASQCYQAIRAGAAKVHLAGPDTTNTVAFFRPYAANENGLISDFSQHYYPLGCPSQPASPASLVQTLLSSGSTARETTRFNGYAAETRMAGAPLIMSETNSACHSGITGVSDSFASALWVIDYLLTGAEHGVTEMNISTGLNSQCTGYTVFCKGNGYTYRPQPIYYGMLFTHLLGAGHADQVKIAKSSASAHLTAFAVRAPGGGLRIMVENLSGVKAKVTLAVGRYRGRATILRLTGPSPLATSGARIQGAAVRESGSIRLGRADTARCTASGCPVTLNPYSAAVIKIG